MGAKKHARLNECGHPEKKHFCRGMCKACYAKDRWKTKPAARETSYRGNRRWRRRHLEIARKMERDSKKRHELANWSTKLFYKYGITADEYVAILKTQDDRCALCHLKQVGQRLAVDHNHETNAVRGLLCTGCNVGLARYEHWKASSAVEVYLKRGIPTVLPADKGVIEMPLKMEVRK
jgi:hypothetical protein